MLLEIRDYCGTRRLLVIVLQFLGLNHHLAVTSTKFPQNPEMKQRHNCRLLTSFHYVRFETLTAMLQEIHIFSDVMLCH